MRHPIITQGSDGRVVKGIKIDCEVVARNKNFLEHKNVFFFCTFRNHVMNFDLGWFLIFLSVYFLLQRHSIFYSSTVPDFEFCHFKNYKETF